MCNSAMPKILWNESRNCEVLCPNCKRKIGYPVAWRFQPSFLQKQENLISSSLKTEPLRLEKQRPVGGFSQFHIV